MEPLNPGSSSVDLRGFAERSSLAADAVDAAEKASKEREAAAAAALAAEQSAQAANASARAKIKAIGAPVPVTPPAAPATAMAPASAVTPQAHPPVPPAPPTTVVQPAPTPSGGDSHRIGGWIGFALAIVAIVAMLILFVLINSKANESSVAMLRTTFQSAIDRLNGRNDAQDLKIAANISATAVVKNDLDNNVKPAVKRAQDTSDQALVTASVASAASAKCSTCGGSSGGSSSGNTDHSKSKGFIPGGTKGNKVVTPVVVMNPSMRETRSDGICLLELTEPSGTKVYVRLDTEKNNGNLLAAKVDDKAGRWNTSNKLSYVGDGNQTVHMEGVPSCKASIRAFTSARAFPWTSTRIGVNGCVPGAQV